MSRLECVECSALEFMIGFVKDGDHDGTFFAKDAYKGYAKWANANKFAIASLTLFGRILTKHVYKTRTRQGVHYVVSSEANSESLLKAKFVHDRQHTLRVIPSRKETVKEVIRVIDIQSDEKSVWALADYVHEEFGLLVMQEEPDAAQYDFLQRLEKLLTDFSIHHRHKVAKDARQRA